MTALLVALVVIPGTVGDVLSAAGMKRHGDITDWSARGLLSAGGKILRNPYLLACVPTMAVSFFALLALLSTSAISLAVPLTASSYILETALARYILHERVDWKRWAGALLVAAGVALLSF